MLEDAPGAEGCAGLDAGADAVDVPVRMADGAARSPSFPPQAASAVPSATTVTVAPAILPARNDESALCIRQAYGETDEKGGSWSN